MPKDAYNVVQSSIMGAPANFYTLKSTQPSVLDFLEESNRPYLVAVTAVVESPMKLFVQNQNYSKILFGSNDQEVVKNVVRSEANLKWHDLLRVLPIDNKRPQLWKITDFNNLMNENPLFWAIKRKRTSKGHETWLFNKANFNFTSLKFIYNVCRRFFS